MFFECDNTLFKKFVQNKDNLPDALRDISAENSLLSYLVFTYPYNDVFEEVIKRTSYIGARRKSEDGKPLLDEIAMTRDDEDIFKSHFYDACARVFEFFGAFCRKHKGAYLCLEKSWLPIYDKANTYQKGEMVVFIDIVYVCRADEATGTFDYEQWDRLPVYFYSDNRVNYLLEKMPWFNENFLQPLGNAIYEAIVNYIIWKWFLIAYPVEAHIYYAEYVRNTKKIQDDLSKGAGGKTKSRVYMPL